MSLRKDFFRKFEYFHNLFRHYVGKLPLAARNKNIKMEHIKDKISFLGTELVSQILEVSSVKHILKGTEILREEQYIKVLPIVLKRTGKSIFKI